MRVSVVSVLNCRTVERSKYFYFFLLVLSTAICLLLRPLFFSLSRALSRCYYAVSVFRVFLCISNYIYLYIYVSPNLFGFVRVLRGGEERDDDDDDDGKSNNHSSRSSSSSSPPLRT